MTNKSWFFMWGAVMVSVALLDSACTATSAPTVDPQAMHLGQTQVALQATSLAVRELMTQLAAPTATGTAPATPTLAPNATPTSGPVVVDDDFAGDVGRWRDCPQCIISQGSMYMGPYPAVDSARGYMAICADCGVVETYKMAVDVTYMSGASDRGFGLVLWEDNGNYIDFEISTWKTYAVWLYDKNQGDSWQAWTAVLPITLSSAVRPGRLSNHLDAVVSMQNGKKMMAVNINGRAVQSTQLKGGSGHVGLVVGLHSIGVAFDNFHFEATP